MQMTVLVTSLIGMAIVVWFFVSAIRDSGVKAEASSKRPERHSAALIVGLLLFGGLVTVGSLWSWPHALHAESKSETINVSGAQWFWEIDKTKVPVGTRVVFNVHSKDVNHGMGVVDPAGRILFQTQGMPGYVNKVAYTFTEPGTYRVLCLEFCGVAHHDMINEFQVVAESN